MNLGTFITEVLIILIVSILAVGVLNPFWMPMGIQMVLLLALIILFGSFAVFLWREQGGDEREVALLRKSDRVAFLSGSGVLLLAIVVEGVINHTNNPWILGAFVAMIIAKAASLIYNRRNG